MRTWLVVGLFLAVLTSPMLTHPSNLELGFDEIHYTGPIQASVSSSSGWITGGEEITITGSGFSALDDTNVTYDGINHQWTKTTADFGNEAGHEIVNNAINALVAQTSIIEQVANLLNIDQLEPDTADHEF